MSFAPFIATIDEVLSMKAEEVNIFGITAMIIARFCSAGKAMTWKELAKAHNATCVPCLKVSEYSDGRDGLNFRNVLFEAEHESDHELHNVLEFKKDPNEKAHFSEKKPRAHLKGVVLKKAAAKALGQRKSRLAKKFYRS